MRRLNRAHLVELLRDIETDRGVWCLTGIRRMLLEALTEWETRAVEARALLLRTVKRDSLVTHVTCSCWDCDVNRWLAATTSKET